MANGNEFKKAIMSKITLHASHCLTVTACNCLITRWNSPMWHFWDGCKDQSMANFFFFKWTPRMQLQENSPAFDKFAWDRVIQFGRIHTHLLILKKKRHLTFCFCCHVVTQALEGDFTQQTCEVWRKQNKDKTKRKNNMQRNTFALPLAFPVWHTGCQSSIGHFRFPKTLTFKIRLRAQPFLWKWVLFAWEWKMISNIKGWAPTLVLKQRPGGTRKWPFGVYI